MKTIFRTLTLISAMSIVLLLANCSKEDPAPDDVIVGKWNITSVDATITIESLALVDYFISIGHPPEVAQDLAEINEAQYEWIVGGSIEFKNGGTCVSDLPGNDLRTGTWELSSDRKTLTADKGTPNESVFTVATLTSANLNMSRTNLQGTMSTVVDMSLTK